MIVLDFKTVQIFAILVLVGMVAARLCVMRFSKTYPGFGTWTAASAVHALTIAIGAVGMDTDSVELRGLAIVLLPIGATMHVVGFMQFLTPGYLGLQHLTIGVMLSVVAVLGATALSSAPISTLFLISSVGQVILFLGGCCYLTWAMKRVNLSVLWLVLGCAAAALALGLLRIGVALFELPLPMGSMSPPGNAWGLTLSLVMSVMLTISQIALNAQRLTAELEESAALMETLATTDALTGLLNRRSFMERAAALLDFAKRHNRSATLLMCDLDHFKQVNDRYGHPMGDQVLAAVGETLRGLGRAGDFSGRVGGEEFALILAETNAASGGFVAERVRRAIAAIPAFENGPPALSVSIGLATYSPGSDDLDTLVTRADRALYQAKRAGRDRWIAA